MEHAKVFYLSIATDTEDIVRFEFKIRVSPEMSYETLKRALLGLDLEVWENGKCVTVVALNRLQCANQVSTTTKTDEGQGPESTPPDTTAS